VRRLDRWIMLADQLGTYRSTTVAVCCVLNSGRSPEQTAKYLKLPLRFVEKIHTAANPLIKHRKSKNIKQQVKFDAAGCCYYCGAPGLDLQVDHKIPKSRGGTDARGNLVAACRNCNSAKGNRTPEEWLQ
jgi:5-methylcytosine-specific restriction endonuclease McrA